MSIVVFIGKVEKTISKNALELMSVAQQLSDMYNCPIVTATTSNTNEDVITQLKAHGVDKIYAEPRIEYIHSLPVIQFLSDIAEKEKAEQMVLSHDFDGRMIAPGLSVRLDMNYCAGLSDIQDGVFKREVFSGKGFEYISCKNTRSVISVVPNSFEIKAREGKGEILSYEGEIPPSGVKVISSDLRESTSVPLPEAERVVSGGRGLKGPENWGMIEELAKELNASTACSRPVSDSDWRPHHEHVGQTGIAIRPNLYIAIGISGATQHLAGVNGSKVKVVINNDPEAPFFKAADYGIVGDAFELVPQFIEEVKKRKK